MEINYTELKALLAQCRAAVEYAWDHQAEIMERSYVHTLYGPFAHGIGALAPSVKITSVRARKLCKKTRRKTYVRYDLDQNFQPVRTTQFYDNGTQSTFYHFELFGVQYAYSYSGTLGKESPSKIFAILYKDGKPVYYASAYRIFMYIQFFEYTPDNRVLVSTYRLFTKSKYTPNGYEVNWDAPIGAPNSPVQVQQWAEEPQDTDLSKWFK